MGDPFEGTISKATVESYADPRSPTSLVGFQDSLRRLREALRRNVAISCWHIAECESTAMWSQYAGRGSGIAIRSTESVPFAVDIQARHLESLGHAVVVANPSFAPMYATRSSRVKTDKRDARTRYVAIIKAFVRREGLRLASGEPERTAVKLAQLDHSPSPVSVRRSQSRGPVAWMADIATSLAAFAERGVVSLCR